MLKIIQNNPYRILGVYSNSPVIDRVANSNRLKAYLKVGKEVTFPIDLVNLIPTIQRTENTVDAANNSINIPNEQLKFALFWFINGNAIDKMAVEYLQNGNVQKATELFEKKETFSSLINQGVLAFINGDSGQAIQCITEVIHNDDYRKDFIEAVCGTAVQVSETDVAQLFIETLLEEINVGTLKDLFYQYGTSVEDDDLLREKAIGEPISAINVAVAQAKNIKNDDALAQYQAGITLINSTKSDIEVICCILGSSNVQYQMVADNLAKQILQCGINYYINSKEDEADKIDKALDILKYSRTIAVGKLTKDRCNDNISDLEKKKKDLPPKEVSYYDEQIMSFLVSYIAKPKTIRNAIELIKRTVPYLMSVKEVLGSNNSYYLRVSTLIVNASLNNVIEEFNNVVNDQIKILMIIDHDSAISKIRNVVEQAWNATLYMDKLDMESDFRNGRYAQNRNSLKEQAESIIIIFYKSVTLDMRGETQIYKDCNTINDYNNYIEMFPRGKYVPLAKTKIEKLEFDACRTTHECDIFNEKYPLSQYNIEAKREECYFTRCTTKTQLEEYLREYPNGRYVTQANSKIETLSYNVCKTIANYQSFLKKFPAGKHANKAKAQIDKLSFDSCSSVSDYKKYMSSFPHGKYYNSAKLFVDDEELWAKCISEDTKDMYKEYLAKFPNGRHKTVAERKASACYIATMVYGDYNHPQVLALRAFRDNTLQNSVFGRAFIHFYYKNSPKLVEKMQNKKSVNYIIRSILDQFIKIYNHESK